MAWRSSSSSTAPEDSTGVTPGVTGTRIESIVDDRFAALRRRTLPPGLDVVRELMAALLTDAAAVIGKRVVS